MPNKRPGTIYFQENAPLYGLYSGLYDIKFMCLYWPVNFLEKQADHGINKSRQQNFKRIMSTGNFTATKAVSTPVPVTNRTLAYRALESGLRTHEIKMDRPRSVHAPLN